MIKVKPRLSFRILAVTLEEDTTNGPYSVGSNPIRIEAEDFNGDGIKDLATSNYDSQSVSIFLGQGDGTFTYNNDYAIDGGSEYMVAGDLNFDGNMETWQTTRLCETGLSLAWQSR